MNILLRVEYRGGIEMKREYQAPVMIMEEYVAEQYVAASECGTHITTVPNHGHVQIKGSKEGDQIHCAFTSSNCGTSSTCVCIDCNNAEIGAHNVITTGTNLNASKPEAGTHNCHILDNHDDAVYFAANYKDEVCGDGVAKLLGLNDFSDIVKAWS